MSLLTDADIAKILCEQEEWNDKNQLQIYPYNKCCLTPVGYDLRVGYSYASTFRGGPIPLEKREKFKILPGETLLIYSVEKIGMPQNKTISGLIVSRVSLVSMGLSHISTSIDPDWQGRLLVALHNHSSKKIYLRQGDTFCTSMFIQNLSPAEKESCKDDEREELFFQTIAEAGKKAKRRRALNRFAPYIALAGFGFVGWLFNRDITGIAAFASMGGVVAQILTTRGAE